MDEGGELERRERHPLQRDPQLRLPLGGREIFQRRTSGDPRQQTAQSMTDGPGFQSAEPFEPAQALKIHPRVHLRRIQQLAAPGGDV